MNKDLHELKKKSFKCYFFFIFWKIQFQLVLQKKPVTPTPRLWTIRCLFLCLLNAIVLRLTSSPRKWKEEKKKFHSWSLSVKFWFHSWNLNLYLFKISKEGSASSSEIYAKCGNQFFIIDIIIWINERMR